MVSGTFLLNGFRRMQMGSLSAAQKIRCIRLVRRRWQSGVVRLLICTTVITATLVAVGFYHVYFDRTNLPDIEPFTRFEFPTIGHIYDANCQPLIEMAREYRRNIKYEDIPPIVRDAILATKDKNFFTHSGVDYSVIPRVLVYELDEQLKPILHYYLGDPEAVAKAEQAVASQGKAR